VATRQDGVERAAAIVAAAREEYSGEELCLRLGREYEHAVRVAAGEDEEWLARVEVYWQALLDEEKKQNA
jgi:hypothetical protein